MTQTVDAIYEKGALRLIRPLTGVAESSRVRVTVEAPAPSAHPLADCIGILPDEDASEMAQAIEDEFERVNPDDWR